MITSDEPTVRARVVDARVGRVRAQLWRALVEVTLGCAAPVLVAALVGRSEEPDAYRPGALLLATVVLLAVLLGRTAGWAATVTGAVVLAAWFTDGGSGEAYASLAVFAATATGIMQLVTRHDRALREALTQERTAEELLDQSPAGVALVDRDMRFEWANSVLARTLGVEPTEARGRTLSELDARLGATHEPVIAEVVATGAGVRGRVISERDPATGTDRHWRADYFPVHGDDGRIRGVGLTVEEVTADVVARRRSELLLGFTRELASANDEDRLASALVSFLSRVFEARAVVAVPTADGSALQVLSAVEGYDLRSGTAWGSAVVDLDEDRPICEAARTREIVTVAGAEEWDRRYPQTAEARAGSGDESCACVPVLDPVDGRLLAVFRIAWPYRRILTDASRTLCGTVASITAAALDRMSLAAERARDRFRAALEAMLDDVAIGEAVRRDGAIVDFRVTYVTAQSRDVAGRSAVEQVDRLLTDLYPGPSGERMVRQLARIVESGKPAVIDRMRMQEQLPDGLIIDGCWSVQVSRLGDGFICAWRDVTDVVELERSQREAERTAEREAISVELLQRAALPVQLPDVRGLSIGAHYRPASEQPVGGDWFDAFALPDGQLALVIADVAGHGTDAAAVMVQVRNILRAMAAEHRTPELVLLWANRVTALLTSEEGPFVTACYGLVDVSERRFSWASAGHLPPLHLSAAGSRFLDGSRNPPLAITDDAPFRSASVDLHAGDRLVLYTDGLVERRGEVIDEGLGRLAELARDLLRHDAQETAERLGGSVSDPRDDLAVMVVDLLGDPPAEAQLAATGLRSGPRG